MKLKTVTQEKISLLFDRASRQIKKEELKYRLEEYGKIKRIKIRQDKYGRLGNAGMVCLETKEEANIAIQDLNEATRYIAKEYEPQKQRMDINSQDITHTITAKEKEQKRNPISTVTIEHISQTTQSTNRSEQNKEKKS